MRRAGALAPLLCGGLTLCLPAAAAAGWQRFDRTVDLDAEDWLLRFDLRPDAPGSYPLDAIDVGRGAGCDIESGPEDASLRLEAAAGFAHLVDPRLVWLDLAEAEAVTVVCRVPRPPPLDQRVLFLLPPGPWAVDAAQGSVALEFSPPVPGGRAVLAPGEVARTTLPDGRRRWSVALGPQAASPLPSGVSSWLVSGEVFAVGDTGDWTDLTAPYAEAFRVAVAGREGLAPALGRLLAQPDAEAARREALRIALDTVALDRGPDGLGGLPRGAGAVLTSGHGGPAERAALLVALLRGAELRAEPVLVSSVLPEVELPSGLAHEALDRVVVALVDDDGGVRWVDPRHGAARAGVLDEELQGHLGLRLGPAARWVRLPVQPGRAVVALNAVERADGDFDVEIDGQFTGAPAARVRAGLAASGEGGWLAGWAPLLQVELRDDGGTLDLVASGTLPAAVALPGGALPPIRLPRWQEGDDPADDAPSGWRSVRPVDVSFEESWTLRGRGIAPTDGQRIAPRWTAEASRDQLGPVAYRKVRLTVDGGPLPPAAPRVQDLRGWLEKHAGAVPLRVR